VTVPLGERYTRMLQAVDEPAAAGQLHEAADAARSLLAGPGSPVLMAVVRLRLASLSFIDGRVGEVTALADAVLDVANLPGELYTVAQTSRLLAAIAQDDVPQARRGLEILLAHRSGPGSDAAEATALAALGFLAWDDGRIADSLSLFRTATERAAQIRPEARRHQHPRLALASLLVGLGDFEGAAAEIDTIRAETCASGEQVWAVASTMARAQLCLAAGDLADAVDEAQVGLAHAERIGAWLFVPAGLSVLASAALATGDLRAASAHLRRRGEGWRDRACGMPPAVAPRWVEARLAEARVGPRAATPAIVGLSDDLLTQKRLIVEEPAAAAWFVRVLLALDERERAESVTTCARLLAAGNPGHPTLAAAAAQAQGLLGRDASMLVAAADQHRHPWSRGSASEDAGVVLLDVGDRATARMQCQRALVAYERAGALRDATRVRRRLIELTARRRSRLHRPVCGWASLTDTERRVAHVVAAGVTNAEAARRLCLSRHTVDYHLRQIFRKLAIRSRVELTAVVVGRNPGEVATVSDA
jgi:DNA-binding CsgD family transcriptional regulator